MDARALRRPGSTAIACAGVFVLAGLVCAIAIGHGINPNDEGIVLQAAARVAHGQLPYRDFYANYGPGEYYLVGLLNLVFGPSLLSWRILGVVFDGLISALAFALVRREAGWPLALLATAATTAALAYPQVPNPNTPMLVLAFAAVLTAGRWPVAAGALAGAAVAFRPDAGLAVVAGAVIAALGRRPGGDPAAPGGGRRAAVHAAASAVLVACVLLAPFFVSAPEAMWNQTLGFDFGIQSLQRLPLPGLDPGSGGPSHAFHHYYPYVLLAAAALWLVIALSRRIPLRAWALAPLAAAGVAYLLGRPDDFHLIPLAAVLPVLLATAVVSERRRLRAPSFALACLVLGLITVEGLDLKRVDLVNQPGLAAIQVDVADGVRAPVADARALSGLVAYVRSRVPSGEPVFVANPRYDLVNVGDPLLYVLLQRPNPTRYDVMQPGVMTAAPVQREIVRALERARPKLVVRWLSPLADQVQPDGAGHSSGVHILDRYLARRYVAARRFDDYLVLRPRG